MTSTEILAVDGLAAQRMVPATHVVEFIFANYIPTFTLCSSRYLALHICFRAMLFRYIFFFNNLRLDKKREITSRFGFTRAVSN